MKAGNGEDNIPNSKEKSDISKDSNIDEQKRISHKETLINIHKNVKEELNKLKDLANKNKNYKIKKSKSIL